MQTINTVWKDKMAFEWNINGYKMTIDAKEAVGGENKGPQPKPFMLAALGGCTAMDVISILRKMRVADDIADFQVDVSGELTEDHPKQYHKMHVKYIFKAKEGKTLAEDKLKKAIELSEEKYCGVNAVYKKALDVSSELVIK